MAACRRDAWPVAAFARRHATLWLAPLFVLAVLATGWLRLAPLDRPMLAATMLADAGLTVRHHEGAIFAVDLAGLSVASRGERIGRDAGPSALTPRQAYLFEDGQPLRPGRWIEDLAAPPGAFMLRRQALLFSASDGSDPRRNGRRYALVIEVPRWQIRAGNPTISNLPVFADSRSLWPAAAMAVMALGFGAALGRAAPPGSRRKIGVLCFAAVIVAWLIEAAPGWNDVAVMFDSDSYMAAPRDSLRPPGYWLLAKATMTDPRPSTFADYPLLARIVGEQGDGALRLVRTQKVVAGLALLAFGASLCLVVAPPVAAALTLGLGNMAAMVPFLLNQSFYRWGALGIAGLLLLAALAMSARGAGRGRWRPVLMWAVGVAAAAASGMVVEFGAFAGYLDWVQAETLTISFILLTLAGCVSYLLAGWRWMLPAAAACATLAALTHPGSLYLWIVVLGLLPVAFVRGRREFRFQTTAVAALLMLCLGALYLFTAVVPRTVQLNELHRMAFALRIAEPDDVVRMPDAASRAFLRRALDGRDQRYQDRAPGAFRNQLHALRFDIGWPAALAVAAERGEDASFARGVVTRAANAVLAHRPVRYLGVVWESLRETPGLIRISQLVPWWGLLPAMLLLAAAVRGWQGYFAALLVLAAFGGYLLIAMTSGPIPRLTHPIDVLLYLGCVVLIAGAWRRIRPFEG